MSERLYIQSNHLSLIKQLIDYSIMYQTYQVKGISMSNTICIDEINEKDISVYLLDDSLLENDALQQIKKLKEHSKCKDLAVIYICKTIHQEIIDVLNGFVYHKICLMNYNFFEILVLIFIINDQRNHTQFIEHAILMHLRTLCFKENLHGFQYIKRAISLEIEDSHIKMHSICDKIAREYHVTSSRVERCMRTSIDSSYRNHKDVYKILYKFDQKPTCMHFICKIAKEIVMI